MPFLTHLPAPPALKMSWISFGWSGRLKISTSSIIVSQPLGLPGHPPISNWRPVPASALLGIATETGVVPPVYKVTVLFVLARSTTTATKVHAPGVIVGPYQ